MVSAECLLCKKGFRFTSLGCANYVVSCDLGIFVLIALDDFIRGKRNYKASTDTKHNTKSSRYKFVIVGNKFKNIGIYIIGSGLLK